MTKNNSCREKSLEIRNRDFSHSNILNNLFFKKSCKYIISLLIPYNRQTISYFLYIFYSNFIILVNNQKPLSRVRLNAYLR